MKKILSLDESVTFCMLASALAVVPKWEMWIQIAAAVLSIILLFTKKGMLYKYVSTAVFLDALYEIAANYILKYSFVDHTLLSEIENQNLVYALGVFVAIFLPILFLAWTAYKRHRDGAPWLLLASPFLIALSKDGAFLIFVSLLCMTLIYETKDNVLKKIFFILVPLSMLSGVILILADYGFRYEYMYSTFGRIGIFFTLSCYVVIIALFVVLLRKANNSLKNICIPAIIGGVCLLSSMIDDGAYIEIVSMVHFFGYISFTYAFYSFYNILNSKLWGK